MKRIIIIATALLLVLTLSAAAAEEWICPACGNSAGGNFCNTCGGKRPEAIPEYWICPACGNSAGGNFCNTCGTARPTEEDRNVPLGKMEIFQRKTVGGSNYTYTDKYDKYLKDNYGNEYTHSVSVGAGSLTYLVNHEYLTFSGTVACPKGVSSDDYRSSATLRIYGDGELIGEFKGFCDGSKPETFSINIKAYERVTLEWTCKGMNIWNDWGYFATIFDGVFVPAY